jgi:rare lipoprotein A
MVLLAGCASAPKQSGPQAWEPSTNKGGYYQDDGPAENPPLDLASVPDAEPKNEALQKFANHSYEVMGNRYLPDTSGKPYTAQGLASWYGRKFHGKKTSSGEVYDMYGMTAAHRTLPIPSYARVTNLLTGKSVVVRINDRGPFHPAGSSMFPTALCLACWRKGARVEVSVYSRQMAKPQPHPDQR